MNVLYVASDKAQSKCLVENKYSPGLTKATLELQIHLPNMFPMYSRLD